MGFRWTGTVRTSAARLSHAPGQTVRRRANPVSCCPAFAVCPGSGGGATCHVTTASVFEPLVHAVASPNMPVPGLSRTRPVRWARSQREHVPLGVVRWQARQGSSAAGCPGVLGWHVPTGSPGRVPVARASMAQNADAGAPGCAPPGSVDRFCTPEPPRDTLGVMQDCVAGPGTPTEASATVGGRP